MSLQERVKCPKKNYKEEGLEDNRHLVREIQESSAKMQVSFSKQATQVLQMTSVVQLRFSDCFLPPHQKGLFSVQAGLKGSDCRGNYLCSVSVTRVEQDCRFKASI